MIVDERVPLLTSIPRHKHRNRWQIAVVMVIGCSLFALSKMPSNASRGVVMTSALETRPTTLDNEVISLYKEIVKRENRTFTCPGLSFGYCGLTTCTPVPDANYSACPCALIEDGISISIRDLTFLGAMQSELVSDMLRTILLGTIDEEEMNTRVCEALQTNAFFPNGWNGDLISLPVVSHPGLTEALVEDFLHDPNDHMNCSASTPSDVAFCELATCFYTNTEAEISLPIKKSLKIEDELCQTEEPTLICLCPNIPIPSLPPFFSSYREFVPCSNSSFSCDLLDTGACIQQGPVIVPRLQDNKAKFEELIFKSEILRKFYDGAQFPSVIPGISPSCAAFHPQHRPT